MQPRVRTIDRVRLGGDEAACRVYSVEPRCQGGEASYPSDVATALLVSWVLGLGGGRVSERRGCGAGRGFSTIEVLAVVGILVILAAITVIGFRFVGDRARGTAVRVTLETLRGALLEAESAGLLRRQPPGLFQPDNQWVRIDPESAGPYGNGLIPDLWRRHDVSNRTPGQVAAWSPGNVTAGQLQPGLWTAFNLMPDPSDLNNWRDAPAIKNTALALAMMRTVPGVAKTLDGLPNSVSRIPEFYSPTLAYVRGQRVVFRVANNSTPFSGPAEVFVAVRDVSAGVSPVPGADTADWARDFGAILDGFGNPILFVPSSGLHIGGRYMSGRSYDVGDRVFVASSPGVRQYFECIQAAPAGTSPSNTSFWRPAQPIRSPDGKPFWASAGPDGDFDTPGDNLYSFEN